MCMYEDAHARECVPSISSSDVTSWEHCARCAAASPKWTGVCSYRCLIPTERAYHRKHRCGSLKIAPVLRIITYQISGSKYLNFVAICREPGGEGSPYQGKWVADVPRDEVVSKFIGWEPEVEHMLECVENPSRWAVHALDNLPFAVSGSGNIALLGDAVYARYVTELRARGGQAIEDVYIIGRLLASPDVPLARVPVALRIYEDVASRSPTTSLDAVAKSD
ncbi:hypothetical protein C8T65DRAFT_758858 [Cerioporus squamosus]|nr:hypothetical protein C8T65DRAFT_758858 [Cerioporus squamosus]